MPKRKSALETKPIEQYTHADKRRANNPQVRLVTPATDKDGGKQIYNYDPHHAAVLESGIPNRLFQNALTIFPRLLIALLKANCNLILYSRLIPSRLNKFAESGRLEKCLI